MRSRFLVPELMDDPAIDPIEHRRALRGLRRINAVCRTGKHLADELIRIADQYDLETLSVLDLGCGSGDIATNIASRLSGRLECNITGWDISETAITTANEYLARREGVKRDTSSSMNDVLFQQMDVFAETQQRFDVIYCCLFLHHFSESQAIELLSRMRELANYSVLIDDLHRTSLGLFLAKAGCQLLSRSPVVHFDGPQSVRAAFTIDEARELAVRAGLTPCTFRKHWPERYLMRWDAGS